MSKNNKLPNPYSVNLYVTKRCNFNCKYCFSKFRENDFTMPWKHVREIPALLKELGTKKITFVGGEPLLYPRIWDLIKITKKLGMTTMIITNGSLLTESILQKYGMHIDWIGISIDSQFEEINRKHGRGYGSISIVEKTIKNAKLIHKYGIKLKINTVVTKLNYSENMCDFILELLPSRWKVFQVMRIQGQNDNTVSDLLITDKEFELFKMTHEYLKDEGINVVFENNELMRGSYVMMDIKGRFFTNKNGYHEYTDSIFDVGVERAYSQLNWDPEAMKKRGGIYKWD